MSIETRINVPSTFDLEARGHKVDELCYGSETVYELDGERWFVTEDGSVFPLASDGDAGACVPEGADAAE